jgi:2-methylcitrate dehydratase PrpD
MSLNALLDRAVEAAVGLELRRVPPEALEQAGHIIADTVGVSRGGGREPAMERLLMLSSSEGTIGRRAGSGLETTILRSSTVLSTPTLASSPEHAAFLNATAGSFLEMDEGIRPTGHPAMQLVPAAIAVAEQLGSSGEALLRAVIAGYETTFRLFHAFRLRYPVHPHGHFGAVGGAVAVALLRGVDPVAAARIAATTPVLSIWDACYEGATARNSWMGMAAASAVRASTLAQAGFTGSSRSMEIAFDGIAGDLVDPEALTAPLDHDRLGITGNYYKRHSACALTHAALDALFQLSLPDPERIERILVETVSNNLKLDRQAGPSDLSARFSLPYAMATGVLTGRSDPDAFRFRAETGALAERVEVTVAPELEARWPDASPARVTVHWDGGSASAEVENPHGYHTDPMTPAELRGKFEALVADERVATLWWERLTGLAAIDDCAGLLAGDA